jgi:hypothetical protein
MNFEELTSSVQDAITAAFGEADPCIHKPQVGDEQSITGVFSKVTRELDELTGITVIKNHPRLGVKLSDLDVVPTQGDVFEVRGEDFKVVSVVPDGEGWAVISLHKQ